MLIPGYTPCWSSKTSRLYHDGLLPCFAKTRTLNSATRCATSQTSDVTKVFIVFATLTVRNFERLMRRSYVHTCINTYCLCTSSLQIAPKNCRSRIGAGSIIAFRLCHAWIQFFPAASAYRLMSYRLMFCRFVVVVANVYLGRLGGLGRLLVMGVVDPKHEAAASFDQVSQTTAVAFVALAKQTLPCL